MAADFFLTQGDLLPAIKAQLRNPDGSIPDLNGAQVWLRWRNQDDDPTAAVLGVATITDLAFAQVQYNWAAGDTDRAGVLLADWLVQNQSGAPESFPDDHDLRIKIKPKP